MLSLMAAGQVAALRAEESSGHLENFLVRPVSRLSWFAGRLGLAVLLLATAGVLAGAGSWAGAASQHTGVGFGSLIAAGLNVVPPSLFLPGLGALAAGAWPRRAPAVVYGYLAWSFLVEFIGAIVHASHWLLDTSVFFHMAPAPATSPDWASAAAPSPASAWRVPWPVPFCSAGGMWRGIERRAASRTRWRAGP